ncbi:MAG: hypothetical protein KAS71_14070, partial [Bacteroidales bacterium]|nr:hypothetical protein [Bacteroidales bacterium]
KKLYSILVVSFLLSSLLYGQPIDQKIEMIKNFHKMFSELQPTAYETDIIDPETAVFAPLSSEIKSETYTPFFENTSQMFTLDELSSYYTIIDNKELPINNVQLIYNYNNLPGFINLNLWFEIDKVEDMKGKNLLLSQKIIDKYRELGIIDDDFGFIIPGEASEKIELNRELEWQEKFNINGTIHIEYPKVYSMAVFTEEERLKKKMVDEIEFQLVQIKDNMVTYLVKGDRRKIENIKVVLLNKDNKPFLSSSSMGIDADEYDIETNTVKQLSDEEIKESVENFNYSDFNIHQVKRVHIEGSVAKVIFLRIKETAPLTHDFSITMEYYQDF